jgi:hypothetical protein
MCEKSQNESECVAPGQRASIAVGTARHPARCDRSRCTSDIAGQTNDYQAGARGEHRSRPVPLAVSRATSLPGRCGEAYLSEAVAPWPCGTYLRVRVGNAEVDMAIEDAAPVLSALAMLRAAGQAGEGVASC